MGRVSETIPVKGKSDSKGQRPGPWLAAQLFNPVLASLLSNRWVALLLVLIGAAQVALVGTRLGWTCPVKAALGIPCPGCGLSTAVALLFRGEWLAALAEHAFAPVFVLGFALMAVVSLLPESPRRATIERIAGLERRTGFTTLLLLGLMVYWGLRLFALL